MGHGINAVFSQKEMGSESGDAPEFMSVVSVATDEGEAGMLGNGTQHLRGKRWTGEMLTDWSGVEVVDLAESCADG